jgi:uncharacterized UPF0160 family protein
MKKFVTHDGPFHADDVMGAAILQLAFKGEEYEIKRTRNVPTIERADVVFDVGTEHTPRRRRFDHHQRGGAGKRNNGVPYAAAGLLWAHYGARVCGGHLIADIVDRVLIQPIDAADCGVKLFTGGTQQFEGVAAYSFSRSVSAFNPSWDDDEQDFDNCFFDAVDFARSVLISEIENAKSAHRAKKLVERAIQVSWDTDPRVIELPKYCPWEKTVTGSAHADRALFVIYEGTGGTWMVQCVPPEFGSFEQREPFPEMLRGLRSEKLQAETGVADAVFVHPGGFIGGAGSLDGARALVEMVLPQVLGE